MSISINHRHTYDTHTTYDVSFFDDTIHTTVTYDPDTITEWIIYTEASQLYHLDRPIIGLDVEWRPSFSRHQNPVATLQLCVGTRCLIYQICFASYIPETLLDFFDADSHEFVGVGVKSDLAKLLSYYNIGRHANAVELGKLAASVYDRKELRNKGLKDLASFVLGKRMEKPRSITMSAWDSERLTYDQVKYACVDAYASFEIARVLYDADNN